MKGLFFLLAILLRIAAGAQPPRIENLVIVTTDGLRWQEVFRGMDSVLAEDPRYPKEHREKMHAVYGAASTEMRRAKLMPFLWSAVAARGQLYGDRDLGNRMDNANPYWFSYPGYSELFCGFVDTAINSNAYPPNPNTNLLEYLNRQPAFRGKVAAFGAWNAFDRIFNETRSGFPVTCGGESVRNGDPAQALIGEMKRSSYTPFDTAEYLDVFTHYQARQYLERAHPRVLYIAYGETDEWAHAGNYPAYLDAARQVDRWLSELWDYLQRTPAYRGKTALLVTVDHGRGRGSE